MSDHRVKVYGPEVKRLSKEHVNQAVKDSGFWGKIEFYAHQTTEAVDRDAFKSCQNFLAVVHLPSVLTIEPYTFNDVGVFMFNALKEVSMPSVNHIGQFAFSDCKSLEIVHPLLNAVTIDDFAFFGCSQLKIDIGEVFPQILSVGDSAFCNSDVGAKMLKIKGPGPRAANRIGPNAFAQRKIEHIVSENVTIQCEAFKNCHNLKSVQLTNCITHAEAFQSCKNLETVLLKNVHLTNLVDYGEEPRGDYFSTVGSFDDCSKLNTLHVDGSLTMMSQRDDPGYENNPFYGCNIKRVVLHGRNHESAPNDIAIIFERQQHPPLYHQNIRTVVFHCSMLDDKMWLTRWLLPVPANPDEYSYRNKKWNHNLVLERNKAKLIVMPMDTTMSEFERQMWAQRDKRRWDRDWSNSEQDFPELSQDDETDWAKPPYFVFYMQEIPFKLTNNSYLEEDPSNSYFTPAKLARFISDLAFPPRPILPGVGAKDQAPEKPGERKAKDQVPENPNDFPVLFVRMAKLIADAFGACPEDRYHPLLVQTVKKVDRRARRALIYFIGRTAPRAFHLLHIAIYGRQEEDYVPEIRGIVRRDLELPEELVRMMLYSLLDPPFTPEQRRAIRTVYEGDGKDVRRQLEDKAERTQTKSAMLLANPRSQRTTGIATPLFAICVGDGPRN